MKDMKESLSSNRKADTTHVRRATQIYMSRPCEYGSDKYERGNYRRPTGGVVHDQPTGADFKRLRSYLRAARDHIDETLDAMELHLAGDPELKDVIGMKRAAYAPDTDVTPGAKVGASLLPHVAPALASLNMAVTQAADCGLLPRDPGTPWRGRVNVETMFGNLDLKRVDSYEPSLFERIWIGKRVKTVAPETADTDEEGFVREVRDSLSLLLVEFRDYYCKWVKPESVEVVS